LKVFLRKQGFDRKLSELLRHSASYATCRDRFFRWFNAFLVMKYLHFARGKGRQDVPVELGAGWLLKELDQLPQQTDPFALLQQYRLLERGNT